MLLLLLLRMITDDWGIQGNRNTMNCMSLINLKFNGAVKLCQDKTLSSIIGFVQLLANVEVSIVSAQFY